MTCQKKAFEEGKEAEKRARQIRSETNGKTKMRPYKCDKCGKWHLTSMSKHTHKFVTNVQYRNEVYQKAFIRKESAYWEVKLLGKLYESNK